MALIAYIVTWVATSTAVSFGLYYTGSIHCLWALLIPALARRDTVAEGPSKDAAAAGGSKGASGSGGDSAGN